MSKGGSTTPTVTKRTVNQPAGPAKAATSVSQKAALAKKILDLKNRPVPASKKGKRK